MNTLNYQVNDVPHDISCACIAQLHQVHHHMVHLLKSQHLSLPLEILLCFFSEIKKQIIKT